MLAAQTIPPIVQALVPLALGLYGTLAGFGFVPMSLDAKKAAAWQKRHGATFRTGGPLLVVIGVVLLVRALWLA